MASFKEKKLKSGRLSVEAKVVRRGHPSLSKSFPTRREAQAWATEQERTIRLGGTVSMAPERTTFAEAVDEFMRVEAGALSVGTVYCLGSLKHHLGVFTLNLLDAQRIEKFIKLMLKPPLPRPINKKIAAQIADEDDDDDDERTYSESAVRKYFFTLKACLTWHASEHRYALDDRFNRVKAPRAWSKPRKRRLEGDEEARLMEATNGMRKSPESWRLLIRLALETAMRGQEIRGLLWSEVNMAEDMRFILLPAERTKTDEERQVPLSRKAMDILARLKGLRAGSETRVFPLIPPTSHGMGTGFRRICKRAGILDLRFHDLRHEATSRMFERTELQTVEVMLMTGHTQVSTLKRYANLRQRILAEKLDGKRFATEFRAPALAITDNDEIKTPTFNSVEAK